MSDAHASTILIAAVQRYCIRGRQPARRVSHEGTNATQIWADASLGSRERASHVRADTPVSKVDQTRRDNAFFAIGQGGSPQLLEPRIGAFCHVRLCASKKNANVPRCLIKPSALHHVTSSNVEPMTSGHRLSDRVWLIQ